MSMIPGVEAPRRGGATVQTLIMIGLAVTVLGLTFLLGTVFGTNAVSGSSDADAEPQPVRQTNREALTEPAPPEPDDEQPSFNPPQVNPPQVNPPQVNPPQIQPPQPQVNPGLPPIRLNPAVINVGTLRPQTKVEAASHIINVGAEPLRILESRASCQCTAIDMAGTVIPPGGSVPLVAIFDSQTTLGPKSSAVRLRFEGYAELVDVRIVADVALPVRALPAYINGLEATSGRFILESEDGRPFNVLAVDGAPPPFVDFDPEVDAPRNRYTLSWDISDFDSRTCQDATGERMRPWVLIETDHPECRVVDLSIRHMCTRRQGLTPGQGWFIGDRRAMVGQIPAETPMELTHKVRWMREASPNDRIVTARSLSPQVDVEFISFERDDMDSECLLRVTPKPGVRGVIYADIELTAAGGRTDSFTLMAYAVSEDE